MPSQAWPNGSTRAWRQTRDFVLDRDNHECQLQLKGCTQVATHAHHTKGRAVTGDDRRFIVAACPHCNWKAGDVTQADPAPTPRHWWT